MIGKTIKLLRESKKLGQEELARMAGLGRATIVRLETGETNIRLDTLEKIARALDISLAQVFSLAEYSTTTASKKPHNHNKKVFDPVFSPVLKRTEENILSKIDTGIDLLKKIDKKIDHLGESR